MRRYNQDRDRGGPREHAAENQEGYVPEAQAPREPRESPFRKPARIRIELRRKFNDPEKNFKEMLQAYRREINKTGLLRDYKAHQTYESKGEKRRKTQRDARKRLLMDSLTQKILAGERVDGHGGMVKKIMADLKKDKEKRREKKERNAQQRQQQQED